MIAAAAAAIMGDSVPAGARLRGSLSVLLVWPALRRGNGGSMRGCERHCAKVSTWERREAWSTASILVRSWMGAARAGPGGGKAV